MEGVIEVEKDGEEGGGMGGWDGEVLGMRFAFSRSMKKRKDEGNEGGKGKYGRTKRRISDRTDRVSAIVVLVMCIPR